MAKIILNKSFLNYCFLWMILSFGSLLLLSAQSSPNFRNYSLEDGLSNNYVHAIHMDNEGWLWFGTFDGLNRFDGYEFRQYRSNSSDSTELHGRMVKTIFEEHDKTLWFGTEKGLNRYNRELDNFELYSTISNDSTSEITIIHDIAADNSGRLWLGTETGLLQFDKKTGKIIRIEIPEAEYLSRNPVHALLFKDNILWIGTNEGVVSLDLTTGKTAWLKINIPGKTDPRINEVQCIYLDSDNTIWIGTYLGGLNKINKETGRIEHIYFPYDDLRSSTVRAIIETDKNTILAATRDGLIRFNKNTGASGLIRNKQFEESSLVHNSILSLYKDLNNDIWIGTRGGISYLNNNTQVFNNIKSVPGNQQYINSPEIWTIMESKDGKLWIGTEDGGINTYERSTGNFEYITTDNSPLKSNNIKALHEDIDGNIWVGTYMGGLYMLDKSRQKLKSFSKKDKHPGSITDDRIWCIYEDKRNRLWFGTSSGLDRYDRETGHFHHYLDSLKLNSVQHISEDINGNLLLTADEQIVYIFDPDHGIIKSFDYPARYIFKDSRNNFWIGTIREGLVKMGPDFKFQKKYTISDGLSDNTVYGILEDGNGFLWLSTLNGISRFNPLEENFKNYYEYSGLPGNKFNYGAFCKTRDNEMVFGGNNGFTIFHPLDVKNNTYVPPVVFTGLRINNKPVGIMETVYDRKVLNKAINQAEKITLNYHHSVLSLEFAALNYASSMNNKYKFKLEGFDEDYSPAGHQRVATYTNLNPGEYTFMVMGSNNDGIWNPVPRELQFEVLPPYWKTWWFKTLLFLALGGLITFLFFVIMKQERLQHQIAFERLQAKKIHEMDTMKFKLFTDISHEIRTPLTLIMSPLEKILKKNYPDEELNNHLILMQRNSKRLLSLVNQLLDYRKLEAGKLKMDFSKNNLVPFVRGIVQSFEDLSREQNINLSFNSVSDKINLWFDPDKLEIVIYNLVSNAFKFTGKNGKIGLALSMVFHESKNKGTGDSEKYALLTVEDTGIGIPEDQQEQIFNRFYQSKVSQKIKSGGTGIGLALAKEIIELHNGEIAVESKPGEGAKFSILLPLELDRENEIKVESTITTSNDVSAEIPLAEEKSEKIVQNEKIVLIVEDNEELLNFITSYFKESYQVITALDGKEGLDKAFKFIPDVIISDVLMPEMDGKELCQLLKNNDTTSHIPLILLTALASKNHEKDGFVAGADAYITKPFDPEILKVRVDKILEQRHRLQLKYRKNFSIALSDSEVKSPDELFLQKAAKIVNKHIEDADFDITRFSKEIGISRTQLYRKFDAVMNITVKDFIKQVRLEKAAAYLQQGHLNVSEITFKVGFKDVSYFRKCFKNYFGISPSEYQKKAKV